MGKETHTIHKNTKNVTMIMHKTLMWRFKIILSCNIYHVRLKKTYSNLQTLQF